MNMRFLAALLPLALLIGSLAGAEEPLFLSAKPVWPVGRETEMNVSVGFRAVFAAAAGQKITLRLAAASIYRATVNGSFLSCGPARGPHGFYRVDQWDVSDLVRPGENVVAIEVAGYNCNSFYLLDQPSFLEAEVSSGPQVLASTAGDGAVFTATMLSYRVQKVQRYSFQRPFIEVYRLAPGWDRWSPEPTLTATIKTPAPAADATSPAVVPAVAAGSSVELAVQPAKRFLPRRAPYPEFALHTPVRAMSIGRVERVEKVERLWRDRSLSAVGPKLKGYPEGELAVIPSIEMQHLRFSRVAELGPLAPPTPAHLDAGQFEVFDFGLDLTGFLGAKVECRVPTQLYLAFDEILSEGDVDFKRLSCVNMMSYDLEPGTYDLESIEPYTLRYLKLICRTGSADVAGLHVREYAHPAAKGARFVATDERLNRLFAAGVETFRQNALDIFMDCPSRERAGWLCDSFFTARTAYDLTGTASIEHNFFENFLLPERFAHLPEGMLPMCYPADHYDGVFIPNWALWFVVQLEQYVARSGDRATAEALRPRVMRLLDYFRALENSDGLLEKLQGWVFVEWSAANEFVQDVNYPSNMLYTGALDAASRLYQVPELADKAQRIRGVIRRQSFDGEFFVDNALRRGERLVPTDNHSEVCQYFAFYFRVAERQKDVGLWKKLVDQFGPRRAKTRAFSRVHVANSFIGNMLRMELLSEAGRSQQILDESIAYLLYMADRTGTLWENTTPTASCNHGFASHIVHTLYRDVLGIAQVDSVGKEIVLRFGDVDLSRCEGAMPTPDGPVELNWQKDGPRIAYRLTAPAGYRATVQNLSGKELSQRP